MKVKQFKSLHSSFPDWKSRSGGLDGDNPFKSQTAKPLPAERAGFKWSLGPRRGGIDNSESRVVSDFDQLEADRIRKFGAKVRFDLDQPLSKDQKTIVIDDDGKEHTLDKGKTEITLGSYLSNILEQGNKYIVNNTNKIFETFVKLNSNKEGISVPNTVKLTEIMKVIDPSGEKDAPANFNYCTLAYYRKKDNKGYIDGLLAKNKSLNGIGVEYMVKSLAGNQITGNALYTYSGNGTMADDILDIRNCQILKFGQVPQGERVQRLEIPEYAGDDEDFTQLPPEDDEDEGDEGDEGEVTDTTDVTNNTDIMKDLSPSEIDKIKEQLGKKSASSSTSSSRRSSTSSSSSSGQSTRTQKGFVPEEVEKIERELNKTKDEIKDTKNRRERRRFSDQPPSEKKKQENEMEKWLREQQIRTEEARASIGSQYSSVYKAPIAPPLISTKNKVVPNPKLSSSSSSRRRF
jgi:hypothetical protein